jgi:hypothetical protein
MILIPYSNSLRLEKRHDTKNSVNVQLTTDEFYLFLQTTFNKMIQTIIVKGPAFKSISFIGS